MKKIFIAAIFFGIAVGTAGSAQAQKVRLRSKITPDCTQVRATTGWRFADLFGGGDLAVLGSYGCNGAFIFDVSNPDAPVLKNWYNPTPQQQFLEAIVIGNRGYFGSGIGNDGVHIVDLSNPAIPVLLGKVNSTTGGGYNTIHEMMVFDQGSSRYLLENSNSTGNQNLRIIDVTNPAQPILKWDFPSGTGGWIHAMHIRGTRAYFSAFNNSKVDIYDLTNLAAQAPVLAGTIAVGSTTNHSTWTNETGEYLYSARETSNGDVRVYDVRNPAQPLLIRSVRAADLNINAITPHNPVVMGNKLYVAWYQAGTQVFDISDPTNPVRVGQYDSYQQEFAPPAEELKLLNETEPWDIVCGSAEFSNALPNTYGGNWAVYPFLGDDRVLMGDLTGGLMIVDASHVTQNNKNIVSDFDGDAKTDFSVFRQTTGDWLVEQSANGTQSTLNWGLPGDVIAPGDYDGDGKTDNAIFRPSTGVWWFVMSSNGSRPAVQFGLNGDIPVPADYDADGKTDIAVWRPSNGAWYMNQSTLGVRIVQWGISTDKVFSGDYDGDGKADLVAWRPSNGVWYVLQSSSSIPLYFAFGTNGDRPLFADFDGDARSDISVYRPSNGVWYGFNSSNGAFTAYQFGIAEDMPIPADYDGDGKADIAVFRPSTNVWYRLNSSNGGFVVREFGTGGDRPSPSSVQPQ